MGVFIFSLVAVLFPVLALAEESHVRCDEPKSPWSCPADRRKLPGKIEVGPMTYYTDTNSVRGSGIGGGIQFDYKSAFTQLRGFGGIADDNHGRIMANVDIVAALPELTHSTNWAPVAQFRIASLPKIGFVDIGVGAQRKHDHGSVTILAIPASIFSDDQRHAEKGYSAAIRMIGDYQITPHLEVFANLKGGIVTGMKTAFKQTGEDEYTRILNLRDPNAPTGATTQGANYARQQGIGTVAEVGVGLRARIGERASVSLEGIYSRTGYKLTPENPAEGSVEHRNTQNLLVILGAKYVF